MDIPKTQIECAVTRLRIAPERIHFLKFILEGYDHLAVQSTVDQRLGIVELRYPPEREAEVTALLEGLGPQLG